MIRDIQHAEAGDIDLQSGDLLYTESTGQHQKDILLASVGDYKQAPAVGVGVIGFLNDNRPDDLLRQVRKQFQGDGMKVGKVAYNGEKELITDARYGD